MTELKRATVKCHGKFKTSLSINRNGVSISFTAERNNGDIPFQELKDEKFKVLAR